MDGDTYGDMHGCIHDADGALRVSANLRPSEGQGHIQRPDHFNDVFQRRHHPQLCVDEGSQPAQQPAGAYRTECSLGVQHDHTAQLLLWDTRKPA